MSELYPQGPANVPATLTRPTSAYKQRAWWAVISLAVFVLVYLSLAGWFAWTSYRLIHDALISTSGGGLNYLVGGGAAFLAVFMFKALFFLQRGGAPDAVEVTAADQPRLFEFLHRLADEAGAPRPARVYLSPRVNAAVFYDLSILNLLFPSRKNLEIGLALVNVLSVSEIKAVLAHEFGHFAQRSMAIGSWVYVAQQIAAHVIAKRDALDKLLGFISRVDIRVAWIGWLMQLIVWSIRSLMDTLLRLVVLAQRALSRQMEFQADLVAVSLTGSDEIVHALHKLQAADAAWGQTLGFAQSQVRQGRLPHDLFAVQARIIETTARILNDDSYGRVPAVPKEGQGTHRVFKASFAQPPQMWSTHPASSDREDNAKRVYLPSHHDDRSAWLLFNEVEGVKTRVIQQLLKEVKAEPASADDTLLALNQRYSLEQYETRYQGAYLGRALTRHVARPDELYEASLQRGDVLQALAALYPARLGEDLRRLRELDEERVALQALHDKVYQATGGRLVYRGREIARRELPAALRQVTQDSDEVRHRILAHDRQCRTAHLAAAEQLGGGWRPYLQGLIEALHYGEHSAADLRDAQGVLVNVLAIVTADGKVSSSELKRLITAANGLHQVLQRIHQHKAEVQLDSSLLARLEVGAWTELLEDFSLPQAAAGNINDWLRVIDGWVDSAAGACSALATTALEQLLVTESQLSSAIRSGAMASEAPAPSRMPQSYATLLTGQERERQNKLGWWDRFQTADGFMAAAVRLLVAGAIVGIVLGFGGSTSTASKVSLYNGLSQVVRVSLGTTSIMLQPYTAGEAEVELNDDTRIETRTTEGTVIEAFRPELHGHASHYVYNVAGASPLIEWTAVYGNATEREPRMLGAPRWQASSADVFFADPPQNVSTKGGGATRLVLGSPGDADPRKLLGLLPTAAERRQVIQAHTRWDQADAPHAQEWKALAAEPQ